MLPLDVRTVDRIAKLVCDPGGPFERSGRELEQLLHAAGWQDPPEYDGSPRVRWLCEAMVERRNDHSTVERFLCRVCRPVEYEDGRAAAEEVRSELNRILEPEQLTISMVNGQPVLAELGVGNAEVFTAPADLDRRLGALCSDKVMVELLLSRVTETQVCEANGAYLLALIGLGSFLEGLLMTVLTEHDQLLQANGFRNFKGQPVPLERVGFALLIDTAHDKGWIQLDAKHFVSHVRDYRNFVHPRNQSQQSLVPDADTLMLCWAPVRAILNDLETALAAGRT